MFHDMFVHQSGLRRAQGTKNEILSLRDPILSLKQEDIHVTTLVFPHFASAVNHFWTRRQVFNFEQKGIHAHLVTFLHFRLAADSG